MNEGAQGEYRSSDDVLFILIDLTIGGWYQIKGASGNQHTSCIPVTPSILWGALNRFINSYSIGWPSTRLTIIGVYEKKLVTLFTGKTEVWDVNIATKAIEEAEESIASIVHLINMDNKTGQNTSWQHGPLMGVAVFKALLGINKQIESSRIESNARILIIDASSESSYVGQDALLGSCLHSMKIPKAKVFLPGKTPMRIVVDVLSIQSNCPSILETLSSETGGISLSLTRELMADTRDNPTHVFPKAKANALTFAVSDFLMFHFTISTKLRSEVPFLAMTSSAQDIKGTLCVCHQEQTEGVILLCPSCAAVYCTKVNNPYVCKVCSLRFKRKLKKDRRVCDYRPSAT